MVKPLHVVKFHNFVIIFSPPSLRLPFVEHLAAVAHHSTQRKEKTQHEKQMQTTSHRERLASMHFVSSIVVCL